MRRVRLGRRAFRGADSPAKHSALRAGISSEPRAYMALVMGAAIAANRRVNAVIIVAAIVMQVKTHLPIKDFTGLWEALNYLRPS